VAPVKKTRRPRSDGIENRVRLLDAAFAIMSRDGAKAVTMTAVAEAAGLTRVAAYRHFASSKHLLDALKERLVEEVVDVKTSSHYASFTQALAGLAEQDVGALRNFILEALMSGGKKNKTLNNIVKRFKQYRKDGKLQPGVDPVAAAMLMVSATYLGAVLNVSRAKTTAERHVFSQQFDRALRMLLYKGLVTQIPEADQKILDELSAQGG
jgi:AcrR family transcriptional regulator